MLQKISAFWAKVEITAAAILAAAITGLILLNVVTRAIGNAIYWVDEAAIYTMAWMTFLAASAAVHHGQSVAVTLVTDLAPRPVAEVILKVKDAVVLVFAILMVWFCWRWYLPLQMVQAGFDILQFQGATFNFIYSEPTTTIGYPKYLVWMVMWLFSFGMLLHSVNNLLGGGALPEDRVEAT